VPRIDDAFDTGSPLRRRRIERGVSIRTLAAVTGVPVTRIQRLEDPALHGSKVEPRLRDIAVLAWALGVDFSDLIDTRWLAGLGLERPAPRHIWQNDPSATAPTAKRRRAS
jgi:hypothetical protein